MNYILRHIKHLTIGSTMLVGIVFASGTVFAMPLVLSNKLGSITEIQNSEVGSNGIVTGPVSFAQVQHGLGVSLDQGTTQVKFDSIFGNAFPDAGTIEFW